MHNLKLYKENPSIFQRYIALTNQKQILIDKVYKKIIENNISKKISLLDIGCADGMVTDKIIDKLRQLYQLEVTGIETSKELINQFKARTDYDINFINDNVESMDRLPKSDFMAETEDVNTNEAFLLIFFLRSNCFTRSIGVNVFVANIFCKSSSLIKLIG